MRITRAAILMSAMAQACADQTGPGEPLIIEADYTGCDLSIPSDVGSIPIWFGFRDGNGSWNTVPNVGGTFTANISSTVGSLAVVFGGTTDYGTVYLVQVRNFSRADASAQFGGNSLVSCQRVPTTGKRVLGRLINYDGFGLIGQLTNTFATVLKNRDFGFGGITESTGDLIIGSLSSFEQRRMVIRRDIDIAAIPDSSSLSSEVDYLGPEAFDLEPAAVTVTGVDAQDTSLSTGVSLADCVHSPFPFGLGGGTPPFPTQASTWRVPVARRRSTDRHIVSVYAQGPSSMRGRLAALAEPDGATLRLPVPPVPMISTTDQAFRRVRFAFDIDDQVDGASATYAGSMSTGGALTYWTVGVISFPGALNGKHADIEPPDLTGAPGWNAAWLPPPGLPVHWFVEGATTTTWPYDVRSCGGMAYAIRVGAIGSPTGRPAIRSAFGFPGPAAGWPIRSRDR